MNVCIIGNSKSILKQKNGSKIDSFDTVVRINTFKIEGFEKHVGTKTDIFATSAWSDSTATLLALKSSLLPALSSVRDGCRRAERVRWALYPAAEWSGSERGEPRVRVDVEPRQGA